MSRASRISSGDEIRRLPHLAAGGDEPSSVRSVSRKVRQGPSSASVAARQSRLAANEYDYERDQDETYPLGTCGDRSPSEPRWGGPSGQPVCRGEEAVRAPRVYEANHYVLQGQGPSGSPALCRLRTRGQWRLEAEGRGQVAGCAAGVRPDAIVFLAGLRRAGPVEAGLLHPLFDSFGDSVRTRAALWVCRCPAPSSGPADGGDPRGLRSAGTGTGGATHGLTPAQQRGLAGMVVVEVLDLVGVARPRADVWIGGGGVGAAPRARPWAKGLDGRGERRFCLGRVVFRSPLAGGPR